MRRTCIILSPYFPPSSLAGVHRARHLVKHLPAAGWQPVVICVNEAFHEERLDHDLARLVPDFVEVVKVPALSPGLCRPLGFGEISLRAWRSLRRTLFRLLGTRRIDAVLITGSPWYPMLLTGEIRRRSGVPVVLDFQDPWVSQWGAVQPRWSKSGLSHRLAVMFEPKAVRPASFITSVSEVQNDQMAARYPWLDRRRMAAIPIGCDTGDFQAMRRRGGSDRSHLFRPGAITFSYVGTFWPGCEPLMKAFLRAFARARKQHPGVMSRVRLLFVGTSSQPNDSTTFRVRPMARACGIDDSVHEVPERLPYLDAISIMAQSDAIILIGSDEIHYTASKIYPALMAGRPFISLFHRDSSAHHILSVAGGGLAFAFADRADLALLEEALAYGICTLARDGAAFRPADPAAYAAFEAGAIASRFAQIFDRLVEERREPG